MLDFTEFSPRAQCVPKLDPVALFNFRNPEQSIKQIVKVKNVYKKILQRNEGIPAASQSTASYRRTIGNVQDCRLKKVRLNIDSKVIPPKGESSDQLYPPEKIMEEVVNEIKKRPPTPGALRNTKEKNKIKNVTVTSIKRANKKNIHCNKELKKSSSEAIIPKRFSSGKCLGK